LLALVMLVPLMASGGPMSKDRLQEQAGQTASVSHSFQEAFDKYVHDDSIEGCGRRRSRGPVARPGHGRSRPAPASRSKDYIPLGLYHENADRGGVDAAAGRWQTLPR